MTNKNIGEHQPFPTHRVTSSPQPISISELYFKTLSLDGLGTAFNMNVDGSSTFQTFRAVCPPGKLLIVQTLSWHIADRDIRLFSFGGLPAPLVNGCLLEVFDADDEVLANITEDRPITRNYEFGHVGLFEIHRNRRQYVLTGRLVFSNDVGFTPFLSEGQYFSMVIQDDLTEIAHFEATLQGRLVDADDE